MLHNFDESCQYLSLIGLLPVNVNGLEKKELRYFEKTSCIGSFTLSLSAPTPQFLFSPFFQQHADSYHHQKHLLHHVPTQKLWYSGMVSLPVPREEVDGTGRVFSLKEVVLTCSPPKSVDGHL